MQIKTSDLDAGEVHLSFGADANKIPALAALQAAGEVRFETPISVTLRALRSADMIAVRGRFDCRVEMVCARCLTPHLQPLDAEFELSYLLAEEGGGAPAGSGAADDPRGEREREIDAREAGLIHFQGEVLDLAEGIAEQVIMGLPYKPLCAPHCKGLCSRCGANLNHETCGCETTAAESPFAVLKDWPGNGEGA
jgi:uncharacterized protein